MKHGFDHHRHHVEQDNTLAALLDRCGHCLAHRVGGSKRGRGNVMAVIAQHPGITQKELADALGIQPASVSELLMKLEQKGLVLREKDEQDRRSMKVSLTEEGQAHINEPKDAPSDPFEALSADEQLQLRSLLEKLLADWEERYPAEHRKHRDHQHHDYHHERGHHHGKHE
ncbi:MAG: MarR family transcriptional regulator [Oscillospiraceae bacterium]|nr:MarR family transcriptional regulator [Oscillospiraceae bacterium]